MTRTLVTGGSGFIGSNLIRHLGAQGHTLLNLDLAEPMDAEARALWRRQDILDAAGLRAQVEAFDPDFIVHLAARTELDGRSLADYPANTTGVQNLIDAAAAAPRLRKVIFASSRLVCRIGYQPTGPRDYQATTPYGQSKVEGEKLVYADRSLRAEWAIVRPTSIWGPFFRVPYRNFFDAVRRGHYVQPRGVRVHKSFGFVGNTVVQLQRLLEAEPGRIHGQMYYLADYEPLELHDWSGRVARTMGVRAPREIPMAVLQLMARTGDLLAALGWRGVPLTSFRLDNLITPMVHDLEPLRAVCGPTPHSLEDGVRATVAWIQQGTA